MSYETIQVEKREGVVIITLNRPDVLNALNRKMVEELRKAIADVATDETVRVLVLKGAGRAFCAGGDVKMMASGDISDIIAEAAKLALDIQNLAKPVIASVNGPAVGAGCNLALACDLVLASDNARFSEVFVNIGYTPDMGGTYFLPHLVGPHKAKELIFTGRMVDANEAEKIGLVNKVVPAEKLEEETMSLAKKLAEGPTVAYAMAKRAIMRAFWLDLASALDQELLGCIQCTKTQDFKEGINAFLEKRKPKFIGK
ncbi:hypothetical protein DRO26_01975 [Candidatus Bathyarchaeota archaeon]|nr:MAG: hypothetical protein DRO26_01975 [Candidatus Bathyarchaeota archaeon]